MLTLVKIGFAMAVMAVVLVFVSFGVLRAEVVNGDLKAGITGNRVLKSETRKIDATAVVIEANGPVDLVVNQGAVPSMTVIAEERLLPHIKTVQTGNTLSVQMDNLSFHSNRPLRIDLTLPALQQVSMHGSGDGRFEGFSGDKIALNLRGSGDVNFDGKYQHVSASITGSGDLTLDVGSGSDADFSITGSGSINATGQNKSLTARLVGSGDLEAAGLQTDKLKIDVLGSGDSSVYARQSAIVNLHGSGDINVHGKPTQREINRSGSGDISWDED